MLQHVFRRLRRTLRCGGLALAALLPAGLAAARAYAQVTPRRMWFERLAQEHGLSNGTVTSIVQGPSGFLWVGTEDGLDRYDGSSFTVFRPAPGDSSSLADAWITALDAGADGIWAGTLHGGVHRVLPRGTGFRHYRHVRGNAGSLSSDHVTALRVIGGVVWAGTVRGLDRLDPATGRVSHYSLADGDSTNVTNEVLAIAGDGTGVLWIGTRRGLFTFVPGTGRFTSVPVSLRTRVVHALQPDAYGAMWVGTEDELLSVDIRTRAVRARYAGASGDGAPFSGRVLSLLAGPDSTLWIGSDGGLTALAPRRGTFERHRFERHDPRSLGGDIVRSLCVDRGGVLWAGVESYGLNRYAPSAVRFDVVRHDPSAPQSLSDGYIRGIAEDRQRNIWIGTQFGGLDRLDPRTGRIRVYRRRPGDSASLPGDAVWAYLEDHNGVAWVGLHPGGLGRFDARTGAFTLFPLLPSPVSVNLIVEDRSGALLVGLEGHGLFEISPDRRHVRSWGHSVGDSRVLLTDDVEAILEDRSGLLWLGGDGGLTRLNRATGEATGFRSAPGEPGALGGYFVTDVFQDRDGVIWVATKGGGLNRYDAATGRFLTFDTRHGLPHDFVYGILQDGRGSLWLSTDDGLAQLDPRTFAVWRYGLEDGLQAREFNRRAFLRAADGTMYFGGINGINIFHPDAVAGPPPPPPVSLVSIRLGNDSAMSAVQYAADSIVRLHAENRSFTVAYAALDFTAPEKITYAYKLEGVDREWVLAGRRREASYASLAPGRYVFRVIAANASGTWNRTGAAVTLLVEPPWWETWWAEAAGVLLLIGAPFAVVRLRLRSIRRRSKTLEQLVSAQTRDLTDAQQRLSDALARERQTAHELLDITAAVPGAVFQLRESPDGRRSLSFVSEGVVALAGVHTRDRGVNNAVAAQRAMRRLIARLDPADRSAFERELTSSRESLAPFHTEVRWSPDDDAAPRWLALHARPTREADGSTVWTGVAMEVTAEHQAQAERAAFEAKMLQAQKMEAVGQLAGGVAHDFNNILAAITGFAQLLQSDLADSDPHRNEVDEILKGARRATGLTRQLLAFSRKQVLQPTALDLAQVVRETTAMLRPLLGPTMQVIVLTADDPTPVFADRTQLEQVLINLALNARDAMPDGGTMTIDVGLTPTSAAAPRMARLSVSDTGTGMPADVQARIFDPFFTTKPVGQGTGLGLATVHGIVKQSGGSIAVHSRPGDGTTFTVTLPLAESTDSVAAPSDAAGASAPNGGTVLLVEDEEAVRGMAKQVLERAGYTVLTARHGADALPVLEQRGSEIDVLLSDVMMPEMGGLELAERAAALLPALPVILMSGYTDMELGVGQGVVRGFIQKPFTMESLLAALQGVLQAAPPRAARAMRATRDPLAATR